MMTTEAGFIPTPEPGIYYDVPEPTYHRWDAISKSWLWKLISLSPKHLHHERQKPQKPTEAMIEGSIVHKLCLEPLEFGFDYSVVKDVDRRTNAGKAAMAAAKVTAGDREIIEDSRFKHCRKMAWAMLRHPMARELFAGGHAEVSLVWDDPETGVRCKARLDHLEEPLITDIKTCRSGDRRKFSMQIYDLGYYVQTGFYIDGAVANGLDVDQFVFATVENEKGGCHDVVIYPADETLIIAGRQAYKKALRTYKQCLDTGHWPGRAEDKMIEIGLPYYALADAGLLERNEL